MRSMSMCSRGHANSGGRLAVGRGGAEERFGLFVGGEECLDAEFIGSDVLGGAEGGDDGEQRDLQAALGEAKREDGEQGGVLSKPGE